MAEVERDLGLAAPRGVGASIAGRNRPILIQETQRPTPFDSLRHRCLRG
jgi:hypothetical protein